MFSLSITFQTMLPLVGVSDEVFLSAVSGVRCCNLHRAEVNLRSLKVARV